MMYTMIVYEREGIVCIYIHWVDVTGGLVKFVLKKMWPTQCLVQCFFTNLGTVAKASFNMHACVWPNDFAHYWSEEVGQNRPEFQLACNGMYTSQRFQSLPAEFIASFRAL